MSHLMQTYARLPVAFTHGQGAQLWDEQGRRYLDGLAGIAVNGLGHAHPKLVAALQDQVAKLIHCSNVYEVTLQETLATRLSEISGMDRVFFCNSGCEANEAAIKLARLYGHQRGIEQAAIIVAEKSFHGRTLATLSATGNRKVQAGFEPLVTGFIRVPFDDLEAVQQAVAHHPHVVAILVEPIQGEGGINVPNAAYLQGLRQLCDQHELLLMLDEIQTGVGRTGAWFAHQHAGIVPDVMTLAKGLGSGVPVGACVARGVAAEVFHPGNHGSTFGGNPLACRAALATLDIMTEENLMQQAVSRGAQMQAIFRERLGAHPGVAAIRGLGLMLGIELAQAAPADLVQQALAAGLLINVTAEKVIRLVPPLVLTEAEAKELAEAVCKLLESNLDV